MFWSICWIVSVWYALCDVMCVVCDLLCVMCVMCTLFIVHIVCCSDVTAINIKKHGQTCVVYLLMPDVCCQYNKNLPIFKRCKSLIKLQEYSTWFLKCMSCLLSITKELNWYFLWPFIQIRKLFSHYWKGQCQEIFTSQFVLDCNQSVPHIPMLNYFRTFLNFKAVF